MALLDFRRKAKEQKEPEEFATSNDNELPEELEKFRSRAKFGPPAEKEESFLPEEYKKNIDEMPAVKKESSDNVSHKLDLILSKLETIDARIKLLEEKLKRFG